MATDHRFRSITELWLDGDHYKWRAMRANGVDESMITGNASDWERFEAWASTVPDTLRNALYHWTHMELGRPFGLDVCLSPATARGSSTPATRGCASPASRCWVCSHRSASPWSARRMIRRTRWTATARSRLGPTR